MQAAAVVVLVVQVLVVVVVSVAVEVVPVVVAVVCFYGCWLIFCLVVCEAAATAGHGLWIPWRLRLGFAGGDGGGMLECWILRHEIQAEFGRIQLQWCSESTERTCCTSPAAGC